MTTMVRPDPTEAAEYFFTYINQVPETDDIARFLEDQGRQTVAFLRGIPEGKTLHRYAPGKWTIRDVVAHLSDCERLFTYRAMWFARGFDSALPSFDQNVAWAAAGADNRSWESLVDEFEAVRRATLPLFRDLPADVWSRRGIASGNPFSVRALAYVTAGHVAHHVRILRERYL